MSREKPARFELLDYIAAVTVLITVAAIVYSIVAGKSVSWNGGCGDDGLQYCLMATGAKAKAGYAQRILLPMIVRGLQVSHAGLPNAFKVINIVSLGGLSLETWYLTRILAMRAGATARRAKVAGLLAGSILLLMPFGFHWTWFYPVLIDNFVGVIGIGWLLCVFANDKKVRWFAPLLALLAVMARESWCLLIGAAAIYQLIRSRERITKWILGASLLAVSLGLTVGFLQPKLPNPAFPSWPHVAITFLRDDLTTNGLTRLGWSLLFSLGLIPLLVLRHPRSGLRPRAATDREADLRTTIIIMITAQFVTALVGYDSHRYFFDAAPLILPIIFSRIASEPAYDLDLFLVLGASVVLWQPFRALDGTRSDYFSFFSPMFLGPNAVGNRLIRDLERLSIPVAVAAIVYLVLWLLGEREPCKWSPRMLSR